MDVSVAAVCGLNPSHLCQMDEKQLAHPDAAKAFRAMAEAAQLAGHDLKVASAYRSFERQAWIWDRKLRGETQLKDADGQPLDAQAPLQQRLAAALRWSAIPGCSRHHWGSDFDIYDPQQLAGHALQLEPWEYSEDGPFGALSAWLYQHAGRFGFYFPYDLDRGGIAPEPWHISYAPVAEKMLDAITPSRIVKVLASHPIEAGEQVAANLNTLLDRYVFNVARWRRP